jgi:hypothetical protein
MNADEMQQHEAYGRRWAQALLSIGESTDQVRADALKKKGMAPTNASIYHTPSIDWRGATRIEAGWVRRPAPFWPACLQPVRKQHHEVPRVQRQWQVRGRRHAAARAMWALSRTRSEAAGGRALSSYDHQRLRFTSMKDGEYLVRKGDMVVATSEPPTSDPALWWLDDELRD